MGSGPMEVVASTVGPDPISFSMTGTLWLYLLEDDGGVVAAEAQ